MLNQLTSAKLPGAACEHRLSRWQRPPDHHPLRLLHRGSEGPRPPQRAQARPRSATSSRWQTSARRTAARYALFQHMIANHDWSMRAGPKGKDCCHNAEMIGALRRGRRSRSLTTSIFRAVGAPYAVPPAEMNITDVKQRFYRGYCAHNAAAIGDGARRLRAAQPADARRALAQTPGLSRERSARAAVLSRRLFHRHRHRRRRVGRTSQALCSTRLGSAGFAAGFGSLTLGGQRCRAVVIGEVALHPFALAIFGDPQDPRSI